MSRPSSFLSYLQSRSGRLSFALVLACAVLLAYFCVRTFLAPLPKSYPLDFGAAQWISTSKPSHGYFRKSFYLDAHVTHAWLQIAAPDNYEVIVNDTRVGQNMFNAACPTGLYDLRHVLREGKNVIAIHVTRATFPGAAQLLVRGGYTLANTPPQEFFSDTTWKVSNTPDGIVGGLTWRSPLLDDASWANALAGRSDGRPAAILPIHFPPQLIQVAPKAAWLGTPDAAAQAASFRSDFKVPGRGGETWVRIAATGSYDVLINGRFVLTQTISPKTSIERPDDAIPLLAHNVTPWVRPGNNTLLIRVHSPAGPPAVLLDGATFHASGISPIQTDETWKSAVLDDGSDAAWRVQAQVLGRYGDAPWSAMRSDFATTESAPTADLRAVLLWSSSMLAISGAILLLWGIFPWLVAVVTGRPAEDLWTADAIIHTCLFLLLLLLLLLSFDIRFANDWCFQPQFVLGAFCLLLASRVLLLLPWRSSDRSVSAASHPTLPPKAVRPWHIVAILALMAVGFSVRYAHLSDISFDVDEMGVILFSKGILADGYAHIKLGSFIKRATTYELVGYPLAAARLLLGSSEGALRFPSLIFSTLTVGLLGWAGCRILDWRAGLVASLIYALHPTCIYWGRNAFWPSQAQLVVLFTVWCFYEAIQTQPFRRGFLTASAVGFLCSYLTWEGSGFVLPALFVGMLLHRWGNYDWLKEWHLWRCLFVMTIVVLLQLCHRQLGALPPYLQTGSSLSEVSTPQLVYLDPTKYNPAYYLSHFVFIENNYTLTLVVLCGLPFCWGDRRLRYLFVVILTLFTCYTGLLPAYSIRYAYHYQTLLILAAAGVLFKFVDRIRLLAAETSASGWPRPIAWAGGVFATTLLILATNQSFLQTYKLSISPATAYFAMRTGLYRNDYRGAAQHVKERLQPGDAIIVALPHVFEHYTNLKVDYVLNTMLNKKVTYDGTPETPRYIDKHRGYPTLRNAEELRYIHNHHQRVWIVLVPFGPNDLQSPETEAYLAAHQKVVFDSYRARVVLLEGTHQLTQSD